MTTSLCLDQVVSNPFYPFFNPMQKIKLLCYFKPKINFIEVKFLKYPILRTTEFRDVKTSTTAELPFLFGFRFRQKVEEFESLFRRNQLEGVALRASDRAGRLNPVAVKTKGCWKCEIICSTQSFSFKCLFFYPNIKASILLEIRCVIAFLDHCNKEVCYIKII